MQLKNKYLIIALLASIFLFLLLIRFLVTTHQNGLSYFDFADPYLQGFVLDDVQLGFLTFVGALGFLADLVALALVIRAEKHH